MARKELVGVRLPPETICALKERDLSKREAIHLGIEAYDNKDSYEFITSDEQLIALIGFVKYLNGSSYSKKVYYILKTIIPQIEMLSNFNIQLVDKSGRGHLIFQFKTVSEKYELFV